MAGYVHFADNMNKIYGINEADLPPNRPSELNQNNMNIAVWDTYFKKPAGSVLHFDIFVPESQRDTAVIYAYGREYLAAAGVSDGQIATDQCQFCHVEAPTDEVLQAIQTKGHYILEMEEIPADLPPNPTRRDMILHLRAHHAKHRFANFSGVSDEELKKIVAKDPSW